MDNNSRNVVTDTYEIKRIELKKNYIELTLKSDTGEYEAILKDNVDLFLRTYKLNEKVICQSKNIRRKDNVLLEIIYVKKYEFSEKKQEVEIDTSELIKRFDNLILNVKDTDYKTLLQELFLDNEENEIRNAFFESPAARTYHHSYIFGLLQHSVEVAETALLVAKYYKNINLDLLCTGALLHDIGKIKSYEFLKANQIIHTDWENLLGHLSISAIFISKLIPKKFDANKAKLLYHLILSHHGRVESGSPTSMKTKEAVVLHYADVLSSTINHIDNLKFKPDNWSEKDSSGRSWYREN